MAKEVFVTKLGTAKGQPRSRIWIEGKRLVDAGSTVGRCFLKEIYALKVPGTYRMELALLDPETVISTAPCKVSGKGEKPIIDITGEAVRRSFGERYTHVEVAYRHGLITIKGSEEHRDGR